jgi:hypothetical protein
MPLPAQCVATRLALVLPLPLPLLLHLGVQRMYNCVFCSSSAWYRKNN